MQIQAGKLNIAKQISSPNCDSRPSDEVSLIVIHCISLPAGRYGTGLVEDLFCNRLDFNQDPDFESLRNLKVSSHLFVKRDGGVVQFVPFDKRAWHAGISTFNGRSSCNDFSVGIELEGTDDTQFTQAQYQTLVPLCKAMMQYWSIPVEAVLGHSDIAPGRKTDPGIKFDWHSFKQALGHGLENGWAE